MTPYFEHVAKCEVTDEEVVKICRPSWPVAIFRVGICHTGT